MKRQVATTVKSTGANFHLTDRCAPLLMKVAAT